ncbi:MAG TPA: chemotaxis protein CheD [Spirochaetota bacterium]|nr:chemotaxis protein CheD [Spirochaetota bacterium]HPJ39347.1 chemotaxis protein CheD [Spirochaetota bacterium]HPQ54581.1 chemotaxis protein CheD [Spirochaetota bacterium]
MYISSTVRYGKPLTIINAGEYHVSTGDEIIGTLLGSCVAVCLYDPEKGISGMNHFMLPGRIATNDPLNSPSAKYGIIAIENLIEAMVEKGARRSNLVAKVFGGGSVMNTEKKTTTIPFDNVRIAKAILEIEDIPIVKVDTGASFTRKLLMDARSGKVFLRKSTSSDVYTTLEPNTAAYSMA